MATTARGSLCVVATTKGAFDALVMRSSLGAGIAARTGAMSSARLSANR